MPSPDLDASRATNLRGLVLVSLSTITWGSGGLFVRLLPFDLWTICFWRGVFGTLFIGAYVVWRFGGQTWTVIRRMGWDGARIAVLSTAVIVLFPAAFQHTSIANAFTVYAAAPFFTAAFAWSWLGERPAWLTVGASIVALAGLVVMLGPSTGGPQVGDLLAFAATACGSLMTVAIRRSKDVEMVPVAALSTALSALISLPLAVHLWDLQPQHYLAAAGFGLGPMTLGMMLYIMGSALIPAALSALIGTAEAPIGALWAWVGVGEVPAVTTMIGGAIVLSSVVGRIALERRANSNAA